MIPSSKKLKIPTYKELSIYALGIFFVGGILDVVFEIPFSFSYVGLFILLPYTGIYILQNYRTLAKHWFLFYFPLTIMVLHNLLTLPYQNDKLIYFLFLFFIFPILAKPLLANDRDIIIFLNSLTFLGIIIALLTIFNPGSMGSANRLVLNDSNPIWLSRSISSSLLWLFILFLNKKINTISFSLLSIILITIMILTGSRGPLVSLFIAGASIFTIKLRDTITSIKKLVLFSLTPLLLGICGYVGLKLLIPTSIATRFFAPSASGIYEDGVATRSVLYELTFKWILENPLGIGIGNFHSYIFPYYTYIYYPHNLLLEFFVELGWLFGIYFTITVIIAILCLVRHAKKNIAYQGILGLLIMSFANSMFSGDMTSPKALYVLLPLSLSLLFARETPSE